LHSLCFLFVAVKCQLRAATTACRWHPPPPEEEEEEEEEDDAAAASSMVAK
jgi:hypothetical protein